jgi:hypothetical protein
VRAGRAVFVAAVCSAVLLSLLLIVAGGLFGFPRFRFSDIFAQQVLRILPGWGSGMWNTIVLISARSIRRSSGGTEDENPCFFTCLPVIDTLR